MKGKIELFDSKYNRAESSDVKIVNHVNESEIGDNKCPSVPEKGVPNSVTIIERHGNPFQERYYDENGNPYLDIDYSNHHNPKTHPVVPHQHHWIKNEKGEPERNHHWEEIKHD